MDVISLIISLLAITNPMTGAAVFIALTNDYDQKTIRSIAYRTGATVSLVLILSGLLGPYILHVIGVSITAFSVAGGIAIAKIGFEMFQGEISKSNYNKKESNSTTRNFVVTPLSIPIICGPAAIVIMVRAFHTMANNIWGVMSIIGASMLIGVIFTVTLYLTTTHQVSRVVRSQAFIGVVTRISGLLFVAIGVEMILSGIKLYYS